MTPYCHMLVMHLWLLLHTYFPASGAPFTAVTDIDNLSYTNNTAQDFSSSASAVPGSRSDITVSTMRMPALNATLLPYTSTTSAATAVSMTASGMPQERINLTSSFSDVSSSLSSTAATFVTRSATFDVEMSSGQNGSKFGVENRTTFVNTADVISSSVTSRSQLTSLDGYDVFLTSWPPVPGNMTSSKPQFDKIGCAVGVLSPVATIVLIVICFKCCRRRCRKSRRLSQRQQDEQIYETCRLSTLLNKTFREATDTLYDVKRHLAAFLDNSQYISAYSVDADSDANRERKLLVGKLMNASQCVKECHRLQLGSDDLVPVLPFRHYQLTLFDNLSDAITSQQILDCVITLHGQVRAISSLFAVKNSGTNLTEQEVEDSGQDQVDQKVLESFKLVLINVQALCDIVRDYMNDVMRNPPSLTPSADEIPWVWHQAINQCSTVDPETFYYELESINPGFRDLADQLAVMNNRLNIVRKFYCLGELDPSTSSRAVLTDVSWQACLLVNIKLVTTGVRELFSDIVDEQVELTEEEDIQWQLTDGAEFKLLLIERLEEFETALSSRLPHVDRFFSGFENLPTTDSNQLERQGASHSNASNAENGFNAECVTPTHHQSPSSSSADAATHAEVNTAIADDESVVITAERTEVTQRPDAATAVTADEFAAVGSVTEDFPRCNGSAVRCLHDMFNYAVTLTRASLTGLLPPPFDVNANGNETAVEERRVERHEEYEDNPYDDYSYRDVVGPPMIARNQADRRDVTNYPLPRSRMTSQPEETIDDEEINRPVEEDIYRGFEDDEYDIPASKFMVFVDRMSSTFVDDVFTQYNQSSAEDLCRQTKVTFIGESGFDAGGPSREFFHMMFRFLTADGGTVQSQQVFHGHEVIVSNDDFQNRALNSGSGHLLPCSNVENFRLFWFVGVLTVQAAKYGSHGLPGLADALRRFLHEGARMSSVDQLVEQYTGFMDVADLELRDLLIKMEDNVSLNKVEIALLETWLERAQFRRLFSPYTAGDAVRRILKYYVFESRMSQLQAIAEGMKDMGYRPGQIDLDLLFPREMSLTASDLFTGLHYVQHDGSGTTKDYFRKFIEEAADGQIDGITLENLTQFITGAPYLSSSHGWTVDFLSDTHDHVFPIVRTCSSEILLPTVHRRYESFRRVMKTAIEFGGVGFGSA